jgi:hypothetical protein
LKNLGCGFLGTEVTPTSQRMAKCEDIVKLTLWDAASDYLISAVLEQLRIFPKVESDLLEEGVLVLLRPLGRDLTCG